MDPRATLPGVQSAPVLSVTSLCLHFLIWHVGIIIELHGVVVRIKMGKYKVLKSVWYKQMLHQANC